MHSSRDFSASYSGWSSGEIRFLRLARAPPWRHRRNPIDAVAKDDYFDSLYHSAAVIGLVTSAFLEAAIVGRPVLTFTLPEYRIHQEAMIHFQYLMTVEGGLLHTAADIDAHLEQLAAAVAAGQVREDRNRRFISAFVRPQGIFAR